MSRSNDIANITTSVLDGVTKAEVGLGNVDNTADSAKPVSTAQQTALDGKASLSGATFTGDVDVNGSELILDADADSSLHASSDDQIDIKIGGTDVGNFNSNTLKLVKDGTPVLEVEDTAETAYSGYWLTAPEMHFRHSTADANSAGLLGLLRFKGTTKTDIGIASDAGTVEIAQLQARSYEASTGVGQRFSDVTGGFSFRGLNGSGGLAELMRIQGYRLVLDSNGGIDFHNYGSEDSNSVTTVSSNLLNDYEEGTCTLKWKFGTAIQSVTQDTRYTKIGRLVTVQSRIYLTSTPSGGGYAVITNFPFAVESGSEIGPAIRVGYVNKIDGDVWLTTSASSTEWTMSRIVESNSSNNTGITASDCAQYSQLRFTAVYYSS